MLDENIERIFNSDSRHKKRIGANVSKRASRRGYIRGGVKTNYDFLNKEQKKQLNGGVQVFSKYKLEENIPTIQELEIMPEDQRREVLRTLYSYHQVIPLVRKMRTSQQKFYKLLKKLNIKPKNAALKKKVEDYKYNISIIPPYSFIKTYPFEVRKDMFEFCRRNYLSKDIAKHLKITEQTLNKKYNELGVMSVPKNESLGIPETLKAYLLLDKLKLVDIIEEEKKETPAIEEVVEVEEIKEVTEEAKVKVVEEIRTMEVPEQKIPTATLEEILTSNKNIEEDEMLFNLNNKNIKGSKLVQILEGLSIIIDNDDRYSVKLSLTEKNINE